MKKIIIFLITFLLFLFSGIMGVFASAGLCAFIWGGDVLKMELGTPPDYTHPAIYFFIILSVPLIIIGFAGGFFLFVIPICTRFEIRTGTTKGDIEICKYYMAKLQKMIELNSK